MNWLSYIFAIAAGCANPVQAGANAQLKKALSQPIWATLAVYATGLIGVIVIQLIYREAWPGADKVGQTNWWAWTGGLLSIASTIAGLTLAQKMGSGIFTGLTITASVIMSVVLDHYGLIGFQVHRASAGRLAGCGLLIAGAWLIAKV